MVGGGKVKNGKRMRFFVTFDFWMNVQARNHFAARERGQAGRRVLVAGFLKMELVDLFAGKKFEAGDVAQNVEVAARDVDVVGGCW